MFHIDDVVVFSYINVRIAIDIDDGHIMLHIVKYATKRHCFVVGSSKVSFNIYRTKLIDQFGNVVELKKGTQRSKCDRIKICLNISKGSALFQYLIISLMHPKAQINFVFINVH